jgi:hypothetical protein
VALESKVGKEALGHYGSGLGVDLEGSDTNPKGGGGAAAREGGNGSGGAEQAGRISERGSSAAEAGEEGLHL